MIFALIFGLVGLIIWRAYPLSRIGRSFGMENVAGAALSAIWGALLLIALPAVWFATLNPRIPFSLCVKAIKPAGGP